MVDSRVTPSKAVLLFSSSFCLKCISGVMHYYNMLHNCLERLHTDLFAVRGHQVEASGGDIQVD